MGVFNRGSSVGLIAESECRQDKFCLRLPVEERILIGPRSRGRKWSPGDGDLAEVGRDSLRGREIVCIRSRGFIPSMSHNAACACVSAFVSVAVVISDVRLLKAAVGTSVFIVRVALGIGGTGGIGMRGISDGGRETFTAEWELDGREDERF